MSQDLVSINDSNWRWTIDENLKIYIPDKSNLEKSLEQFVQLYSTRSRDQSFTSFMADLHQDINIVFLI